MHHPHQLHLAEFCAWHLDQVLHNLDMLAIARSTKLIKKGGRPIEDEATEGEAGARRATEFYGGGGEYVFDEVMEELAPSEESRPVVWLEHVELLAVLTRVDEVAAAKKQAGINL